MENTNKAIGIACGNGYRLGIDVSLESILMDKDWWQALGKGLGWAEYEGNYGDRAGYLYHWHQLITHLASGGEIEEFMKNLL